MSGLRIDAGANRPAGPQRLNLAAPKSSGNQSTNPAAAAAPPSFSASHVARLREVMDKANGAQTAEQQKAVQAELDKLRDEVAETGTDSPQVKATLNHLDVASQNFAASRSRLSDLAAARAAAQLAHEQIRSQTPAALQAQANAAARSTRNLLDT